MLTYKAAVGNPWATLPALIVMCGSSETVTAGSVSAGAIKRVVLAPTAITDAVGVEAGCAQSAANRAGRAGAV